MSAQIVALKIICTILILSLMAVTGYFNMLYTWGIELKSVTSFVIFFVITLFLQGMAQVVLAIKDEN